MNPSTADRYTVRIDPQQQRISVSIGGEDGAHARTFRIAPASRSDRGLLAGALAQTCVALQDRETQIQLLQERLAVATRQLFGASSERKPCATAPAEAVPDDSAAAAAAPAPATEAADRKVLPFKRRAGRKPLAPDLPRIRQEHPLPPDGLCPHCHGTLRALPPDITEQLTVIPPRYEVIRHIRHKAVCRCCDAFTIAPMSKSMVDGSSHGSAALLAYIGCNKYQLGLPYYRQEKLFDQSGVPLGRTTMARLMNACADRCVALLALMKEELLRQAIIHADETTAQVLKEPGRLAQTLSTMWLYCSAAQADRPVILFDYQETRAGEHPRAFLDGFAGYLQVDGYAGYNLVEGVTRVGCMAHVRREFIKALDAIPKEQRRQALAAWPVERIAGLYRIERQYADATPEQRRQARQKFSLPVMNDIRAWLQRRQAHVLPKSLLGKAIGYALGQWERVLVYLDDGRLSIDNNIAERAIKDLVIGRKAWLFADRPEGAHTIAAMHSLVQTAVANGLDPYRYLTYVFETMPQLKTSRELAQLLPWNVVLPPLREPAEQVA